MATEQKRKIVIYHSVFKPFGGTMTWLLSFCKTFHKKYQIIIVSDTKPNTQWAKQLRPYASLVCPLRGRLECDYLIINRLDSKQDTIKWIKAGRTFHMIHCDMDAMRSLGSHYRLQFPDAEYISVSETAQHSLMRVCRMPSIVIPNKVDIPKSKRMLRLVSATRMSAEKGYDIMVKMATILRANNIPYTWDVYTDGRIDPSYFHRKEPEANVAQYFKNYDYVVQLSKSESFCFTLYEALGMGVPVIATPFPAAKQLIKDGKNGYLVNFNLENLDIEIIYNHIPKCKPMELEDPTPLWEELLK